MSDEPMRQHLSDEQIQALLDGELPARERLHAEEHLGSCARCTAELEAWSVLLSNLGDLPEISPREGFAERVMADVRLPVTVPLAARIRGRLEALWPSPSNKHPATGRLQSFLEGALPAAQAARVRTHLEGCAECGQQASQWRRLLGRLDALPRLAPSEAFAEEVMARVTIPTAMPVATVAPTWSRALAAARRMVPRTRRAWAAISGVAVTPAVTLGLVLYAMFSQPALTPGALASFLGWKLNDLALAAWHGVVPRLLESDSVFRLYSLLGSLTTAPWALVGGFAAFSVLTGTALWVLYRNLIVTPATDAGYPHVES
jgi:anti-sigma factor RsiW